MELRLWPDPILTAGTVAVTVFDEELRNTLTEMERVMKNHQGLGLAAPQVGISKRMFVMKGRWFVNPEMGVTSGEIIIKEGCLSFPDVTIRTKRAKVVDVYYHTYKDGMWVLDTKVLEGVNAICFQHELDHLNGLTMLRFASLFKRKMITRKLKRNNVK